MHYKFHFSSRLLLIIFFAYWFIFKLSQISSRITQPLLIKTSHFKCDIFVFIFSIPANCRAKVTQKKIEYIRWSAEWISKWRWHSYSEWRAKQCKVHGVFGDFYLKQTSILWIVQGKPEFSLNVQKLCKISLFCQILMKKVEILGCFYPHNYMRV